MIGHLSQPHACRFTLVDGSAAVEPIALFLHAVLICCLISLHHSDSSIVLILSAVPSHLCPPPHSPIVPLHSTLVNQPCLSAALIHKLFPAVCHMLHMLFTSFLASTAPQLPLLLFCRLSRRLQKTCFPSTR